MVRLNPAFEQGDQDPAGVLARRFTPDDAESWDELVGRAVNGTFLHSRRFLGYHGDRFTDCSLVFTTASGAPIAVLPAALHPRDERAVVSHPGATYGGIVQDGSLHGRGMEQAIAAASDLYRRQGAKKLLYRVVPYIYQRIPSQADVYWLNRLGARRSACDLSTTIDMERRPEPTAMRRRRLRKARGAGIAVVETNDFERFWKLLETTLAERHGVRPVHSLEEIQVLAGRFEAEVRCVIAEIEAEVIAGSVLFVSDTVVHAQYYATSPRGRQLSGLDLVIEHCLDLTAQLRRRYYDFGISTEEHGSFLNDDLLQYKTSFGGGSCIYESYELPLDRAGTSA